MDTAAYKPLVLLGDASVSKCEPAGHEVTALLPLACAPVIHLKHESRPSTPPESLNSVQLLSRHGVDGDGVAVFELVSDAEGDTDCDMDGDAEGDGDGTSYSQTNVLLWVAEASFRVETYRAQ